MKTDQLMSVALPLGNLEIYHSSHYGDLTTLFDMGTAWRIQNGLPKKSRLDGYIKSPTTLEFLDALKRNGVDEPVRVTGKGKGRRTYACLEFLIYTAEYLSPDLHVQAIQTFINSKVLEWRDESGNEFIALNQNVDNSLADRRGKNNRGVFIQIAKTLKAHIKPDGDGWNTASADQLRLRAEIEGKISDALKFGFIKTWPELKDFLGKNFLPKED